MSPAGRSLFLFGIYTVLNGLGLLLAPGLLLPLFGLLFTGEVWVRVAGWLICLLGFYYTASGYQNTTPFIRLTVYGRATVFAFYVVVVLLGQLPPPLLAVGAVDLASAIWTAVALRASQSTGKEA